jgi:hypothetical protein
MHFMAEAKLSLARHMTKQALIVSFVATAVVYVVGSRQLSRPRFPWLPMHALLPSPLFGKRRLGRNVE